MLLNEGILIMSKFKTLKTTPIKEVILGISFDGETDIDQIERFTTSDWISKRFDKQQESRNTKITLGDGGESKTTTSKDGWVLRNNLDESGIEKSLQVRFGSINYHLVNGYVPLSELIDELKEYWDQFSKNLDGISISNISIRYVNFIPIGDDDCIEDYLNVYVENPFNENSPHGFANLKFKIKNTNVRLVTTRAKIDHKLGIVLDYTLTHTCDDNDAFITFKELRKLKNEVFFKSITEKTLKLYEE